MTFVVTRDIEYLRDVENWGQRSLKVIDFDARRRHLLLEECFESLHVHGANPMIGINDNLFIHLQMLRCSRDWFGGAENTRPENDGPNTASSLKEKVVLCVHN